MGGIGLKNLSEFTDVSITNEVNNWSTFSKKLNVKQSHTDTVIVRSVSILGFTWIPSFINPIHVFFVR